MADSLEQLIAEYEEQACTRRVFFRRASALGLSFSAIAWILAGCGGSSGSDETAALESGVAATTTPGTTESDALTPRTGGTLRQGYNRDVSRNDPINTDWYGPPFNAIYEQLPVGDPDGVLVSQLASSWTVNPEATKVSFTIKPGAMFQSGTPCDATAVAAAFNLMRDPDSGNPNLGFWEPVQDVSVVDGDVVVTMKHSYLNFLSVLNNGYAAIPNLDTREELGQEFGTKEADGTGPFVLTEYVPGSHQLVTRWEDYPGSIVPFFSNQGKPYLDAVRIVSLLEAGTRAQEIETGNIDALLGPAAQDVPRLKENGDLTVTEFSLPAQYFFKLNWDVPSLEFANQSIRQAIAMAIDREAIVANVFFGSAVADHSLIPQGTLYYNPDVEQYNNYDPEGAAQLLDEAGWLVGADGVREKNDNTFEFRCVTDNRPETRSVGQAVAAMLRDIGLVINIEYMEYSAYIAEVYGETAPECSLDEYLWPNPFDIAMLFTGTGFAPNTGKASVPELDALYEQYRRAATPEQLTEAAAQAQIVAAETLPFVPIISRFATWVNRDNVHNYRPYIYNLWVYYNDVWMEA